MMVNVSENGTEADVVVVNVSCWNLHAETSPRF